MTGTKTILCAELSEAGTVGGSHRCLFDITRSLAGSRFRPVALFYERSHLTDDLAREGVEVVVWDEERQREREHQEGLRRLGKLGTVLQVAHEISRRAAFLKQHRIDLVHLNNSPCLGFSDWLLAAKLAGVPCIAHSRGPYQNPDSWPGRLMTTKFDLVIAISKHIEENMRLSGIPADRVVQIYDGVDLDRVRRLASADPVATRAGLRVAPDTLLVTMVGHIRDWKGQDVVLEGLRLLPPRLRDKVHVLFVGEASKYDHAYEAKLHEIVRSAKLSDSVTFLGARSDVANLMNGADVVLHASTVPEPFGLVVVEAMALGKPVVASCLGGPAEILDEDSGLLFDPREPQQLADRLALLADNPLLRDRLGAAGARRAPRFALDKNVRSVRGVYEDVLGLDSRVRAVSAR